MGDHDLDRDDKLLPTSREHKRDQGANQSNSPATLNASHFFSSLRKRVRHVESGNALLNSGST